MARPIKEGLSYFPVDVDFDSNKKVAAIMGEFGSKGTLIFMFLLMAIYRNGYYLRWDELEKNLLASRVDGATGELVEQVVKRLIDYGTFDKSLFGSDNVLTSQRIQTTYLDATKRRRKQKPTLYWINVDNNPRSTVVNVDNNSDKPKRPPKKQPKKESNGVNVYNNPPSTGVNADINPQSRSKSKRTTTTNTTGEIPNAAAPDQKPDREPTTAEIEQAIQDFQANFGGIAPITQEQVVDWLHTFSGDLVREAMTRALGSQKPTWNYAQSILRDWDRKHIQDMAGVAADDISFKNQHRSYSKSGATAPRGYQEPNNPGAASLPY